MAVEDIHDNEISSRLWLRSHMTWLHRFILGFVLLMLKSVIVLACILIKAKVVILYISWQGQNKKRFWRQRPKHLTVKDSRFITRLDTWNMAVHFEKLQNPLPTIILYRGSIASACQFICNLNLLTQGKGKIKRCVKITVDLQCTQIWYSSSKNGVWTRLQLLTNILLMISHQMLLIKERNPVALEKAISLFFLML